MNNENTDSNISEHLINLNSANLNSANLDENLGYLIQQHTHTAGTNPAPNMATSPQNKDIPKSAQQTRPLMEKNQRLHK